MVVLDKKYTSKDSTISIIEAIYKLAIDMNTRLMLSDCIEWQNMKLVEIARLSNILRKRKYD